MTTSLFAFSALFTAVLLMMTGIGLLGTTLSLRLTLEQIPAQVIGMTLAAYFVGMVAGGLVCHRLVERVGHIRSFAVFAAVSTAAVLLHGLFFSAPAWAAFRFLTGISNIGLYTVIESWLCECTEPRFRGRVLSVYMLLSYLGMAIGQRLLTLGSVSDHKLFFIVGILLSLCLVPVSVTHSINPPVHKPERFDILAVIAKAPVGTLGCFTSGLLCSAFYAVGPLFAHRIGMTVSELSWFMTATVLGGLVLQWPIGRLSDRFDRIRVLSALGALTAAIGMVMAVLVKHSHLALTVSMGFYGGLIFTIYPVSVARAQDLFESKDIVGVSSALLIVNGVGAGIGPIAASSLMAWTRSPSAFFGYSMMVGGLFACVVLLLRKSEKVAIVPVNVQVGFIPMKSTSPVALQIDPRTEEEIYDRFN